MSELTFPRSAYDNVCRWLDTADANDDLESATVILRELCIYKRRGMPAGHLMRVDPTRADPTTSYAAALAVVNVLGWEAQREMRASLAGALGTGDPCTLGAWGEAKGRGRRTALRALTIEIGGVTANVFGK